MSIRVVIAEDEPLIRLDLKETLEDEGYDVVGQAKDGLEAIAMVRDHQPDVALLDVKMPNLDGLSAAREIMKERLAAVVILTAFSQRDLIEQAGNAGALAYLVKPFRKEDLVPAIELARARFKEIVGLGDQSAMLASRLETRKLVDRAKGVLMDKFNFSEADAFRFLQTTAMNTRVSMHDIANQVITGELAPEQAG